MKIIRAVVDGTKLILANENDERVRRPIVPLLLLSKKEPVYEKLIASIKKPIVALVPSENNDQLLEEDLGIDCGDLILIPLTRQFKHSVGATISTYRLFTSFSAGGIINNRWMTFIVRVIGVGGKEIDQNSVVSITQLIKSREPIINSALVTSVGELADILWNLRNVRNTIDHTKEAIHNG